MAVSGLFYIINLTDVPLNFANTEHSGNDRRIDKDRLGAVGNAWTPWCDNQGQFADHHFSLSSDDGSVNFAIWQSGDQILSTSNGQWSDKALYILDKVGVSYALIVLENRTLQAVEIT